MTRTMQLQIVTAIGRSRSGLTSAELMDRFKISRPTLMRTIRSLREMGAVIDARGTGESARFVCTNWADIRGKVDAWSRLETEQWLARGMRDS